MVASRERQGRGGPPKKFLIRGLIDISLVVTLPFIHNSIRQRRRGVVEAPNGPQRAGMVQAGSRNASNSPRSSRAEPAGWKACTR